MTKAILIGARKMPISDNVCGENRRQFPGLGHDCPQPQTD
jgi:hypothetical protein